MIVKHVVSFMHIHIWKTEEKKASCDLEDQKSHYEIIQKIIIFSYIKLMNNIVFYIFKMHTFFNVGITKLIKEV